MKRFYKSASVAATADGWTVALDGKPIKTPAKRAFVAPTLALAEAAAAEWHAQGDEIAPTKMPVTKSVNTALDRTEREFEAVASIVAEYGGTDLICYRADGPEGLIERQAAAWDPLVEWALSRYNARLITTTGVMHALQPEEGRRSLAEAVREFSAFELTGLYDLVALSGSLIIGLAVAEGRLSPDAGWQVSRVDNLWQEEQWGVDEEATSKAAYKAKEFSHAWRLITLARPQQRKAG